MLLSTYVLDCEEPHSARAHLVSWAFACTSEESHSFRTILVFVFHGASHGPDRVDPPERLRCCIAHIALVVLFFLMILPSAHHAVSWSCLKVVLGQRGRLWL